MIIGHLTTTYALATPLGRRFPVLRNVPPLLVGAYLPDLIDKPIYFLTGFPGRGLGHSAILLTIAFYLLIRAMPSRKNLIIPLAVGAFLHLAEDIASPQVFLWPLLGSWENPGTVSLIEILQRYYLLFEHPIQLTLEVVSYPFCAYALLRRRPAETMEGEAAPASAMPE
ncbi:MAG: metal-dependent hydrolase [Nitrospinota bacterium]